MPTMETKRRGPKKGRRFCSKHEQDRPCSKCGEEGWGGARPGGGSEPKLRGGGRYNLYLDDATIEAIDRFKVAAGLSSRSEAIRSRFSS